MNLSIRVTTNAAHLKALGDIPKYVEAGDRRAANRSLSRLRSLAVQRIGRRVSLRASYIRDRLQISPATPAKRTASLLARRRPTRLDRFPHRQIYRRSNGKLRKAGISVQVMRGGRKTIPSAFLVPLRRGRDTAPGSGGYGIAVRTEVLRRLGKTMDAGAQGGSGSRRYQVLFSLSMAELMRREIDTGVTDEVRRYYEQQMALELQRAVSRSRR